MALSSFKHGCAFGGRSVNHLSYADDMVILSPSATALQKLLDNVINSAKYKLLIYPEFPWLVYYWNTLSDINISG